MIWENFHFIRPLWLLALIPMVLLLWRAWRNRIQSGDWSKVVDAHLLPHLLTNPGQRQRGFWLWLLFIGWLLAVIALAGPAWEKKPQPLFLKESALVILLDLSRSMDATDISPSRLTHARHRVLDILNERHEGQTGLIVYTQQAYVIAPLTDDNATIANLVPTLTTEIMPSQGSDLQNALARANQMLDDSGIGQAHILVISDGVTNSDALTQAEKMASHQRRVSVLDISTPQGSPIPLTNGGFLKDRSGAIVIAKGDSDSLRKLAEAGSGIYQALKFDGSDVRNLTSFSAGDQQQMKQSERENSFEDWHEEGIWLLLPIALLAALTFRRGWLMSALLCVLLIQPQPSYAFEWNELWANKDQQAAKAMQAEQYQQAAEQFKDPQWQASALYRAGDYQKAAEAFAKFDNADAYYNQGNALAKAGNLQEAISAYEKALEKQPDHEDAQANLELVKSLMQQQEQQQSSSDQQQQGDDAQNQQQQGDSSQQGEQQDQQQGQQQGESSQQSEQQGSEQQGQQQAGEQSEQQDQQAEQQQAAQTESEQSDQQQDEQQQLQQAQKSDNAEQPEDAEQQQLMQQADQLDNSSKEQSQAMEQWLRRIPDDPGGLLRRKLQLEYQKSQQNRSTASEQPW